LSGVKCKHENFCRPLEDYGPREDVMEERQVCRTTFEKDCQPVTVSDCMDVTELRCELNLFTNCTMDWTMKDNVESLMSVKTKDLKNCTKEMVIEYHNKTLYDCKNVTKRHCTTLWTVNDDGGKVWAGNEDDCRDVTWEECNPLERQVPMAVAQMVCEDTPVSYFDYENTTTPRMADTMDCSIDKRVVCGPITSKKCAEVTYTRCEEAPVTDCSLVEIPVPFQPKLHKQWCLFDQAENIDFDSEVRKIAGSVENKLLLDEENGQASSLGEDEVFAELTLLDVQSPKKRALDPLFEDFAKLQDYSRFIAPEAQKTQKKKRQTDHTRVPKQAKNKQHVTQNTKIVRMTKNVSQL